MYIRKRLSWQAKYTLKTYKTVRQEHHNNLKEFHLKSIKLKIYLSTPDEAEHICHTQQVQLLEIPLKKKAVSAHRLF